MRKPGYPMAKAGSAMGEPTISGDVVVHAVTVNQKGGSLTATLKKPLRADWTVASGRLHGARMEFADGVACVLMAPEAEGTIDISTPRFQIDLLGKDTPTMEPMTAALVAILQEQIKAGQRNIVPADQSLKTIRRIKSDVAARLKELGDSDI
jgi:hypothetical protein